jgi:hypothetical protein
MSDADAKIVRTPHAEAYRRAYLAVIAVASTQTTPVRAIIAERERGLGG